MTSTADLTPLRIIAFPGAPNLPVFAAIEQGYFAEEGVAVDLTTTPSSVFQFEKLNAGEFDIAMTAFDNVVAYREGQGAFSIEGDVDFVALMGATQIELGLIAAKDIKTITDLKGRSLALDALATGFAFILYEMLAKAGLRIEDCPMVPVGATPTRWESVRDGVHAATLGIEPFTSIARNAGFPIIASSADVTSSYQGGIVAAKQSWAQANAATVEAYLKGYLRGLAWVLDPANHDAAASLLSAKMPAIKPQALPAVMKSLLSPASGLTPDGAILRDGISTVLDLRSRYGGGDVLSDIDKYLDLSFYERARAALATS